LIPINLNSLKNPDKPNDPTYLTNSPKPRGPRNPGTGMTSSADPRRTSVLCAMTSALSGDHIPAPPAGPLPAVSVIMPVLNEERHLAEAVSSILAQDYPGPLEVILALGPSRDATDGIAAALARDPRVRTVVNPSGRTPTALNTALASATGEVIVRLDAHAVVAEDYVRTAVRTLLQTDAVNVGGIMAAAGLTPWQQAVAVAMTSPLGVGGAPHHVGGRAGAADTVYLGVYRRAALLAVGGFDERFLRAQDWEINFRLRQAGGLVWFTPELCVTYRPRATLRGLAAQYYGYGRWRRAVNRRHRTTSLRYLAAPLTVAALLTGALLVTIGLGALCWAWLGPATGPGEWVAGVVTGLGLLPLLGYGALVLGGGGWISRGQRWRVCARVPGALAAMHLCWGWGYLTSPRNLPERMGVAPRG